MYQASWQSGAGLWTIIVTNDVSPFIIPIDLEWSLVITDRECTWVIPIPGDALQGLGVYSRVDRSS